MAGQDQAEYWNPKIETLARDQLRRLQLVKLQRMVGWAYERSPFYRRKYDESGVRPEEMRSLEDVRRLPPLTKSELLDCQAAVPPYGDILTAAPKVAIGYHQTSGTSGRAPLRMPDTPKDWAWMTDAWAGDLWAFGVRPSDVVFVAFSYGAFIGFWEAHIGAERLGATVVAGGGGTSESRIKQILDVDATVLIATPTYALRLAEAARAMGVDLARASKIRLTCHAGEPGANIPATKQAIQEAWGARCGDFAGMTECGSNHMFECRFQPGGAHLHEDHYIHEVVDPRTLEPLGYGERGELLLTSFGRGYFPLLRMRTGDLVERVPADACQCGRTFELFRGGIIGRADDMKLIRGVNVYPSAVENIVRACGWVEEFQIVLTREGFVDEITVAVEPRADVPPEQHAGLSRGLAKELADAHEGLRMNVRIAPQGSLPRFELKSRRLVDKRE